MIDPVTIGFGAFMVMWLDLLFALVRRSERARRARIAHITAPRRETFWEREDRETKHNEAFTQALEDLDVAKLTIATLQQQLARVPITYGYDPLKDTYVIPTALIRSLGPMQLAERLQRAAGGHSIADVNRALAFTDKRRWGLKDV